MSFLAEGNNSKHRGYMNRRSASWFLFLLGTFSMTQIKVVGSIGISELVILVIAPYVFIQDYRILRHDGFLPIVWLSILTCFGCVVASVVNHTYFYNFLRGFAAPCMVFAILVVGHRLVRQSMDGYKWFCLGMALTWIINIFVFQRGVEAEGWAGGASGMEAVELIVSGPLFWISRLQHLLQVPISGWYLRTPLPYSILAPIFMFFFSALTTSSGRSAAVGAFGSVMLVILGGKKRAQMMRLSKNFWVLAISGFVAAQFLAFIYKQAATTGVMGEQARTKYERQVKDESKGLLGILMGGRIEFFYGIYAASKKPIVGYGPWALDIYGYYGEFLAKYGYAEDYESYYKTKEFQRRSGHTYVRHLGAHSHIIGQWLQCGIFGLIFWIYVLCQIVRFFRRDLATVPQWYGMLAVVTPGLLWNIFFSPFSDRVSEVMFMVFILMARAVRLGRVQLPPEMIYEIERTERS